MVLFQVHDAMDQDLSLQSSEIYCDIMKLVRMDNFSQGE